MGNSDSVVPHSSPPVGDGRWDTLFDVFKDQRRRFVLHRLHTSDAPLSIDEVATEIAAWERGRPVDDVDETQVERVEVTLRHVHLPKLIDARVVEYDPHSEAVSMTGQGAPLEALLGVVADE